jgi:hypothetical protein
MWHWTGRCFCANPTKSRPKTPACDLDYTSPLVAGQKGVATGQSSSSGLKKPLGKMMPCRTSLAIESPLCGKCLRPRLRYPADIRERYLDQLCDQLYCLATKQQLDDIPWDERDDLCSGDESEDYDDRCVALKVERTNEQAEGLTLLPTVRQVRRGSDLPTCN